MAEPFVLSDFAYAHRGLWTPDGPVENSLEACLAAARAGLGIEFDVRPSSDGIAMVFHDEVLDRMTAETGLFEARTAAELEAITLIDGCPIISFATLLEAWPATTPLLCEIKIDGATDPSAFGRTVGAQLAEYAGPAAAMSFSPTAVKNLPPGLMRGQVIAACHKLGVETFNKHLGKITLDHADYFACHTSDAAQARQHATAQGMPVIAWTVRDIETCQRLKPIVDAQMFEGFDPIFVKPD